MEFLKLIFEPGINKETTRYAAQGSWWDCDKIRFRAGAPEKIKGWQQITSSTFEGDCRALFRWRTLANAIYTAVGTTSHVYFEDGGTLLDLTPWATKDTGLSSPFTTTNLSDSVEVTKSNHGLEVGYRVEIDNADAVGGISADDLNGVRVVDTVADANTYTFTAGAAATSSTTGGGSSVDIYYLFPAGLEDEISGTGWGSDSWGEGAWGEPGSEVVSSMFTVRTWTFDNFGEDLLMVAWDDGAFYWDASNGTTAPAGRPFPLTTISGASNVPTIARIGLVSARDRHAILFGCDTLDNPGVQDPLHIRWSDQENIANWTPGTTTTAGSLQIGTGTEIIAARQTRNEILVWTNTDLHSMQYVGGTLIYGINLVARGTSIIGRNAATVYLGVAYWMGDAGFYMYDGQVREIPCSVEDYVLGDINIDNPFQVYAGVNGNESEIIWFYPSANSEEVDRYVIYNIRDKVWYIGTMDRTAWIDRSVSDYPIAASADGYLYTHEFGNLDGSTNPGSQIVAYIESSPIELGNGYNFMFTNRLIPDATFRDVVDANPSLTFTLKMFDNPGLASAMNGTGDSVRTASAPYEEFTDDIFVRLRGRSLVYRVEDTSSESVKDFGWRLGASRLSLRSDGRKG